MTATPAFVTPNVLKWARERLGISREALGIKLKLHKPGMIAIWEEGKGTPSFPQAIKLAKTLRIPFGYLFLSVPPQDKLPIPDFRKLFTEKTSPSPELIDVINDAIVKQNWYRELLVSDGRERLPFVGRFSIKNPIDDVARDIRTTIGINNDLRVEANDWKDFLRLLVYRIEDAGILVIKTGVSPRSNKRSLSVSEFLGFAIADEIAPLVFVNGRDFQASQIFTLAHELAHIWIGAGGISNAGVRPFQGDDATERYCNAVAAEALVPADHLRNVWDDTADLESQLRKVAAQFRVSTLVILRRSLDLSFINKKTFDKEYLRLEAHFRGLARKDKSGGDFYNSLPVKNSRVLTRAVIESLLDGKTLYREASNILNVRIPTLHSIAKELGYQ